MTLFPNIVSPTIGKSPVCVIEKRDVCDICYDDHKILETMKCTEDECFQIWFVCSECRKKNQEMRNTDCLVCMLPPPPEIVVDIPDNSQPNCLATNCSTIYSYLEDDINTCKEMCEFVTIFTLVLCSVVSILFLIGYMYCVGMCHNSITHTIFQGFIIMSIIFVMSIIYRSSR